MPASSNNRIKYSEVGDDFEDPARVLPDRVTRRSKRSDREVVLAHQLRHSPQLRIFEYARVHGRARNVCQNLAAVRIHAQNLGRAVEANAFQVAEQVVNGRGPGTSLSTHCRANALHRTRPVSTRQQFLRADLLSSTGNRSGLRVVAMTLAPLLTAMLRAPLGRGTRSPRG